jgi:hypothetical protein
MFGSVQSINHLLLCLLIVPPLFSMSRLSLVVPGLLLPGLPLLMRVLSPFSALQCLTITLLVRAPLVLAGMYLNTQHPVLVVRQNLLCISDSMPDIIRARKKVIRCVCGNTCDMESFTHSHSVNLLWRMTAMMRWCCSVKLSSMSLFSDAL